MISCINKLVYPTAATVAAASAAATLASSSGAPSETQSEISSVDSDWSDIRAIALKLGVSNPDDLHTERFKVDRQKLEQMIKADSSIEGMNGAEYFFESVMKTTETYISWPCRLKIGAKSKKDPHVRIVGKADEVAKAKERILASLDSRGTRVIMKMDVSYTDHSYIIGRGGNNIKRIMEETATHIHFPDSNRSNPTEKSNQVSLCGSLEGVEKARSLVRLSTPLLISFELPVMAAGRPQPDRDTPYVTMVEQKYNVQVIFSSRPKLHSSLVLVKGSEKEAGHVQEATQTLINFSCENIASQILVNMQLEISPQHHEIVKGKNNTNLLSIMERTNTKHNRTFDFDIKRAMGFKAMERPPVAGELRTPTPSWMGMGLSRTSPVPFETVDDLSPWHRGPTGCTTGLGGGAGSLVSPYGLGATTGIVDSTPTNRRLQLTQYKDIHTLLTALGLEHYIKIFVLNEIDLEMFMTLTEENLMELGITAFGARKKMLVAIHTLQANEATTSTMPQTSSNASSPRFSGSAAPGAERRPSNQW
uniref:SAM domain-containing protein n=1 Tax=Musca domestica TaxID=7370 RepID=A0A1I8M5I2_MUSDO